jgi:predicted nucleic acid-binding protein
MSVRFDDFMSCKTSTPHNNVTMISDSLFCLCIASYKQHSAFIWFSIKKKLKQEAYESRKGVNNLYIIKIPDFWIQWDNDEVRIVLD